MTDDDPEAVRPPSSAPCFAHETGVAEPDPRDPVAVAHWRKGERARLLAARSALPVASRPRIQEALMEHLDRLVSGRPGGVSGRVISAYWPIKGELDLRGWMADLHRRGATVALPLVEVPRSPLVFRLWEPGMKMVRGHWNIPVPPSEAPRLIPDVALAPLVGWDGECYRLGYGGGYFDRTLASLSPRAFVVGVGFQSARLATIHPQPHDVGLDAIVTEAGVQFERDAGPA